MGTKSKKMKPDIAITLLLLLMKLTVAPEMPWVFLIIPFLVSFSIGFIQGFITALKDKNK